MNETDDPEAPFQAALGRYVIAFSQLNGTMEEGVLRIAENPDDQRSTEAWKVALGFSSMTSGTLRTLFFGICDVYAAPQGEKALKIARCLDRQVQNATTRRNQYLHSTWYTVQLDGAGIHYDRPLAKRLPKSAASRRTRVFESVQPSTDELRAESDDVFDLGRLVWQFVLGCMDPQQSRSGKRITDLLEFDEHGKLATVRPR